MGNPNRPFCIKYQIYGLMLQCGSWSTFQQQTSYTYWILTELDLFHNVHLWRLTPRLTVAVIGRFLPGCVWWWRCNQTLAMGPDLPNKIFNARYSDQDRHRPQWPPTFTTVLVGSSLRTNNSLYIPWPRSAIRLRLVFSPRQVVTTNRT